LVEEEKKMIDEKIDKSKFAFLVVKSHYYRDLTEAMRKLNDMIGEGIKESKDKFSSIVNFEPDENVVRESLAMILNKCLKVDAGPVVLDEKKYENKSSFGKEYVIKENRVLQIDLINKKISEI
jgi:hypothetical protein